VNSGEQIIVELEEKRKNLNEKLMNSITLAQANAIERELWALRTKIRHYQLFREPSRFRDDAAQHSDDRSSS
jgi:hypothetical protein